jgi:hypothetical protein
VVLALCATTLLPGGAFGEKDGGGGSVSFTFAPADGTTYVQTVETMRELATPDGTRHVDRSEAKARVSIGKTARGFVITTTPLSMAMTRDGKRVEDPALEILDDTVVTYHVSREGKLERVEGYEDAARRVRDSYPPEVAAAVQRLLGPETLVARARAEWEGRIGDFAGRTVAIGKPWDSGAAFTFPNGQRLDYFLRTTVAKRVPCPSDGCVEIRFRYDSDPSALGELAARVPDAKGERGGEVRAKLASLTGAGIRVIDPRTMIVYSERITRTMKLRTETPEGAVPVVTREEQRYSITRP